MLRRDEHGFYFVVGRADDMMICGGENIYPSQVEAVLEAHPAVRQAAVVAVPDERKGQVPVAFVVAAAGTTVNVDELKAFTLENGPAYAHPRRIEILEEMPMSAARKVDKRVLTEAAERLWHEGALA